MIILQLYIIQVLYLNKIIDGKEIFLLVNFIGRKIFLTNFEGQA